MLIAQPTGDDMNIRLAAGERKRQIRQHLTRCRVIRREKPVDEYDFGQAENLAGMRASARMGVAPLSRTTFLLVAERRGG